MAQLVSSLAIHGSHDQESLVLFCPVKHMEQFKLGAHKNIKEDNLG
jgi:hypothetical protein